MAKEILGTKGEAMSKKEFEEIVWQIIEREIPTTVFLARRNKLWAWIEEEIEKTRVDENEQWIKTQKKNSGGVSIYAFENRIKQILEKK